MSNVRGRLAAVERELSKRAEVMRRVQEVADELRWFLAVSDEVLGFAEDEGPQWWEGGGVMDAAMSESE